ASAPETRAAPADSPAPLRVRARPVVPESLLPLHWSSQSLAPMRRKGSSTPEPARRKLVMNCALSFSFPFCAVHSEGGSKSRRRISSPRSGFPAIDDAAADDCCHGSAPEGSAVEGSVARFAGRICSAESPGVIRRENGQVGGLACGDFSLHAENTRRTRGEKFHQAHQRNFSRMHQPAQPQRERG